MQRTYLKKLKTKSYSSYNQRFYADDEEKVQEVLEKIDEGMGDIIEELTKDEVTIKKDIETVVEEALGNKEESNSFRIRTPRDRIIARKLINYYLKRRNNVRKFSKYDDSLSSYLARNYYELGRKLYYRYHNKGYRTYALKDVFMDIKQGLLSALDKVRKYKDKFLIGLFASGGLSIFMAFAASIYVLATGDPSLKPLVWYAGIGGIAALSLAGIVKLLSSLASAVLDNTIIHELNVKIASRLGDTKLLDKINKAFKEIKEEIAIIFEKLHELWKKVKQYSASIKGENKEKLVKELRDSLSDVQKSMRGAQSSQYVKFVLGDKEVALNDSGLFDKIQSFLDDMRGNPSQGYAVDFYCYKEAFASGKETLLNKTQGEGLSKDAIESVNKKLVSDETLVKRIVVKSSDDIEKEKDSFLDYAPYLFIGKIEVALFGGSIKIVYDIHADAVNRVGDEDKYNAMVSAWLIQTKGE